MKIRSTMFAGLAFISGALQAADYTVNALVQTDSIFSEPSINDTGDFTWAQYDGTDWEMFLYQASDQTTRQMTNNDIVWEGMRAPNTQGVSLWTRTVPASNGGQTTQLGLMNVNTGVETVLYTNVYKYAMNKRGDVTWLGDDGNDHEVFLYDADTGTTTQLTDNTYHDAFVQWWSYLNHSVISEDGNVIWIGNDGDAEVYYYNATTGITTQLTNNTTDESNAIMAPNGDALWNSHDGNDFEIMHYSVTTGVVTPLTDNSIDNQNYTFSSSSNVYFEDTNGYVYDAATATTSLVINAAQLGWGHQINGQGDIAWAANNNIFKFNAATGATTQLSSDDAGYSYPVMNDRGDVTWTSNSGTAAATNEVFVYNAADGVTSQLSTTADEDYWPQINALGEVIWAAWDGTVYNIYKAVANAVVSQCEIQQLPAGTYPTALNNNGDVLLQAGGEGRIWNNGETIKVRKRRKTLYMTDINDNRQVIMASPRGDIYISYLWDNGDFDIIGDRDVYTDAFSINNQGQVTGYFKVNGSSHAMLWDNGVLTDLGNGLGSDINNSGQISGYFYNTKGMWDNSAVTPFGSTPDLSFIYNPSAINDKGQMVASGVSSSSDGQIYIALSDNGVVKGTYALGEWSTYAYAINKNGIIAGHAYEGVKLHMVVIKSGVLSELADFLPENSGWISLERLIDLNDKGQIVGSGTLADGNFGYFIMSNCL